MQKQNIIPALFIFSFLVLSFKWIDNNENSIVLSKLKNKIENTFVHKEERVKKSISKNLEQPAADYEIDAYNGQTVTTCSGTFYDSGGSGGDYLNNESYSITFCSNNGNPMQLTFTSWDVEANASCSWDEMRIYNGSSSSAGLIGNYCSTTPGTVTASGTCLHITFTSDGVTPKGGWTAIVGCAISQPVITTNSVNDATCTSADGSINISVSSGASPYSYSWSNGAITQDLTNVVAGTYSVLVTDNNSQQVSKSFTIGSSNPLSLSTSTVNANCPGNGGSVNLTVSGGASPYTYVWSSGESTQDINGLGFGTYMVTVTDNNGCVATIYGLVGCGSELCGNGLDDDGDNLIDAFDDDCPCVSDDFFFGDCTPTCEYVPPSGSASFDLTEEWTGTTGVTNISQLFVADMDGEADGISEVITMKAMTYHASDINAIYLLDGKDGTLKYHPNTLKIHNRNKGLAVGDADGDGRAEFFYMTANDEGTGNSRKIACYEYNPSGTNPSGSGTGTFDLKWTSNTQVTCGLSGSELFAVEDFTVGLTDFDYDGTPEVYVGNEIYNALTGARITTGTTNSIGSWNQGEFATAFHVMAVTVAVDVLPDATCADCSGLELVAGNQVYAVDISSGRMTVQRTAPNSLPDGNTSIVDYDLDGDLDAVITTNDTAKSYLYIWDLQTNTQIGSSHTVNTTSTLFYHPINLPIIADFDGDNRPEIGVCGNLVFQVVEDHLTNISGTGGVLWSLATSDNSGQTGAAVFDFNGDGTAEVVYRDESNLRIMSGPTGANLGTFSCGSGTGGEYAVVADIDNDDETEIICNCSSSPGSSNATAYTKAFKSDQYPWLSTRRIWNQYAYFNVNINDDLTIPQQQQLQHLVGNPTASAMGPLNTFLKQISPLDKDGDYVYPSPDVTISVTTQCLTTDDLGITMTLSNSGNAITPSSMPIAIYNADPEAGGATLLASTTTASSIDEGASITETYSLDVSSYTFPITLYIVANDDGSESRPYSLSSDFPVTSIAECDFTNNKTSTTVSIDCDTEICGDGLDNDLDTYVDCADSDCIPVIANVSTQNLNCPPGTNDGQIVITATGTGTLTYSITNEAAYQSSNTFTNLSSGLYTIRVKNSSGCVVTYTTNIVKLDSPTCVEICNDNIDNDGDGKVDCDDPDCVEVQSTNVISNE